MTRMQLRCSPDQKERWERAAGGAGSLSAWIRDVLDRASEGPVEGLTGELQDLSRAAWAGVLGDGVELEDEAGRVFRVYQVEDVDGVVEEGPDVRVLADEAPPAKTPDEATSADGPSLTVDGTIVVDGPARIDLSGSTARKPSVEEEPVGTSGDAEPDPPLPGEPDGSSSTVVQEESSGASMPSDEGAIRTRDGAFDDQGEGAAASLDPATSADHLDGSSSPTFAAVPAPIAAASLDIVVQRLFPGVKTEDLMAEYESTEHDFNDFLGWLTWRHENKSSEPRESPSTEVATAVEARPSLGSDVFTDTYEAARWYDDTNPEPEDPVDLEPPRMLEADSLAVVADPSVPPGEIRDGQGKTLITGLERPTLSPVCVNAAMHWKLVAGETCRYCGGTL